MPVAQKSNDQIQRDFAAQPWYDQLGTSATDMAKIAANGLTGGLVNSLATRLTGAPDGMADELLRQAKVRAGLAGDVAQVGGAVLGLKGAAGAFTGAKAALGVAPAAVAVAKTAGPGAALRLLTNTAGPGIIALPEAMGAMAKAKAGAKLAGLAGLLGLSMAGRQEDGTAPAAPAAAAPTGPVAADAPIAMPTVPQRQLSELDQILQSPNHTLSDLQAVTNMMPAPLKPASIPQAELGESMKLSTALYQAQVEAAKAALAKGTIDEAGAQKEVAKALTSHLQRRAMFAGNNPLNLAQAQMFGQDEAGN